jgi:hypothetical protein
MNPGKVLANSDKRHAISAIQLSRLSPQSSSGKLLQSPRACGLDESGNIVLKPQSFPAPTRGGWMAGSGPATVRNCENSQTEASLTASADQTAGSCPDRALCGNSTQGSVTIVISANLE